MKYVVIINGKPRSGKDTFVEKVKKCREGNIIVHNISTVDNVKTAATFLGWSCEKDSASREMLHNLKMLSTQLFDGPFRYVKGYFDNEMWKGDILFIHSREPDDIKRFKDYFTSIVGRVEDIKCYTLKIERDAAEDYHNNNADQGVDDYPNYDFTIKNNGSLADLELAAQDFYNKHLTDA